MDVSDREPVGTELLNAVVTLTGLPAAQVQSELGDILLSAGMDPKHLTLDQLRTVMAAYLNIVQDDLAAPLS